MSGGHWNYEDQKIRDILLDVATEHVVQERWPKLAIVLYHFADQLSDIVHDMDWDLSSDSLIKDDKDFDQRAIATILDTVLRVCPDEWFPRGKWATIQAIQGRHGAKT